jgi:hypothetical protein
MNMSVYGIYTAEDCKKKFSELLALNRLAEETTNKETVGGIKNPLHNYYKQGDNKDDAMSDIEKAFFFPAIHETLCQGPQHQFARNLGNRISRCRILPNVLPATIGCLK